MTHHIIRTVAELDALDPDAVIETVDRAWSAFDRHEKDLEKK